MNHFLSIVLDEEWAEANPDNQLGSGILTAEESICLTAGIVLGKAAFKTLDKPKFKAAFKEIIFNRPSLVKCSFLITNSYTSLKSI